MNLAEQFSAVAIAVSLLALAVSTFFAVQQSRTTRNSNYLPVVTGLIRDFRRPEFYGNLVYVTTRLRAEHDPAMGISGLPDAARAALLDIAFYYQSCAWLIELRIISDKLLLDLMSERIRVVWPIVEPYVEAERAVVPGPILELLERVHDDLAR